MSTFPTDSQPREGALPEPRSITMLAERAAREHPLWPVPTAGTRIEREREGWFLENDALRIDLGVPADAASVELRDFDSESILALWQAGLVYLRDDASIV